MSCRDLQQQQHSVDNQSSRATLFNAHVVGYKSKRQTTPKRSQLMNLIRYALDEETIIFVVVGLSETFHNTGGEISIEILISTKQSIDWSAVKNLLASLLLIDYCWRIKYSVKDLQQKLHSISTNDTYMEYYGSLCCSKDSLSDSWQKNDYFRECAKQGNRQLQQNLPYFSHLQNKQPEQHVNQCLEILNQEFREWKKLKMPLVNHYLIYNDFTGWQRELVNWYNHKVSQGFMHNTKQLYVWSESPAKNKSIKKFFDHLFADRFNGQIFYPDYGGGDLSKSKGSEWKDFSELLYSIVCIDQFQFKQVSQLSEWQLIIEGSPFMQTAEKSHFIFSRVLRALVPIVICSNEPPTNDSRMSEKEKVAVLRRLVVIHVDEFENDSTCCNRPLRYIQSMQTEHEPITLKQISSLKYQQPVVHPSKLEPEPTKFF